MTRQDGWEAVGRETLYYVLVGLASEVEASVEPVADTVYWGGEPDAEQVARLRQLAFEFEYAVEAYVAALAPDAEPWGGDGDDGRTPSWEPLGGVAREPADAADAGDSGDTADDSGDDTDRSADADSDADRSADSDDAADARDDTDPDSDADDAA
jgi:hypothetical protein